MHPGSLVFINESQLNKNIYGYSISSLLQKGDKVVIVSPSSKIDQQFLKGAKKRMESWGLKVAMGKYAGSSSGRYAGTIRQRLKDLQDAMDDPKVKAILCSRGGYGRYI